MQVDARISSGAVLLLAAVFALLETGWVGLNNDVNGFMFYALKVWQGGDLYRDIFEINPPLIMLYYAPLAALMVSTHLPPAMLLHASAVLLAAVSLLIMRYVLKVHGVDIRARRILTGGAAFALLVVPSLCSVFADREHLMFVFAFPWIVQMLLRLKPLPLTALFAAFGFYLKPYDLLMFGALTLFGGPEAWSLRQRIFSSSSWIMGGMGVLYAACVYLFFPEYPLHIVALASLIYPLYHFPLAYKITQGAPFIASAGILWAQYDCPRGERIAWGAFILSAALAYFCNSGWIYTIYLPAAPLAFISVIMSLEGLAGVGRRILPTALAASITAVLLWYALSGIHENMVFTRADGFAANFNRLPGGMREKLRREAGGEFILISTTLWSSNIEGVDGQPPRSVFGFDVLSPLPWLHAHAGDPRAGAVWRAVAQPLVRALKEHPSAPVIVDMSPVQVLMPKDADLLAFLRQDPEVRDALSSYVQTDKLENCGAQWNVMCRFAIWRSQNH